ncbi:MAG: L-histidine N(alpha)-methyltransferase [Candidatus Binatia bacterium]
MQGQEEPHVLSSSQRGLWSFTEPYIWTFDTNHADPALSILRTLLDQPRWLEPSLLYDERGSQLFEQICELPEYYLTRTENSILAAQAEQVIATAPVECIVELGAGTSKKTMHLLREQVRQRQGGTFAPIDVSLTGLIVSRDIVRQHFPQLMFQGLHARYEEGIAGIEKNLPTLFAFLGSSVGNFTHSEFVRFFQHLSDSMGPKDFLLLGADRVKEAEILEKAYDDSQGVTADFILNVFQNINRQLGSDFDLRKMRYHSWYNPEWQQIEMYALSTAIQEIHFPTLSTSFVWEKEDRILVEISRKFEPVRLQQQLQLFGLTPVAHFTDPKEWFSLLLFQKLPT